MKKQSILRLLTITLILFCSCSKNTQSAIYKTNDFEYKEASFVDCSKLYNSNALLMFKANSDYADFGDLYIKTADEVEEKISENVKRGQYILLINNGVIYIDVNSSLYLKEYGKESKKIADNVDFYSVKVSSDNSIYFRSYENEDFLNDEDFSAAFEDILIDSSGGKNVLFNSKEKYNNSDNYGRFSVNGEYFYMLNEFGTLFKIDLNGNDEKLAGSVSDFVLTPDGSAFAYTNSNNRLYIKWSGASKAQIVKGLDVYDGYYKLSDNGLSCIFSGYCEGYDVEKDNLMFITPFNDPVVIAKSSMGFKINSNNEYIYILDENDKLYGYKLPKITAKTNAENLIKQLSEVEKVLIGADVSYFTTSDDGKSVSFLNMENKLYTSYEFSEAVKVHDDVDCIDYMYSAIVFKDINSKLYINESYNDIKKVADASKDICEKVKMFYVKSNILNSFFYVDENSNIYTYSLDKKSKLFIDNAKEYTLIKCDYAELFVKSLEVGDVVGKYKFENTSNFYDEGVLEISNSAIVIVNSNSISNKKVSVFDSTQDYISLMDDEKNRYNIYKSEDKLSLEIYDEEANSYYQYNLSKATDDEFNEKIEVARKELKYNAVYNLIQDYYYYGYKATAKLPIYYENSLNSEILDYTIAGNQYYVEDYYVDDDYNFWLNIEYDDSYGYLYIDTTNLEVEN